MATNEAYKTQKEYARMVDTRVIEHAITQLLIAIGEDPEREGLLNTPKRVARFWQEFIEYDPGNHVTVFESVKIDQMVAVSDMRVWSLCEHHLLPFWIDVSIGYIANDKVLGLSKFGRIVKKHAHRLQIQERLVQDIAADVIRIVGTENVAVVAKGEHLCMTMRGIELPAIMSSSSINGSFRNAEVRAEFLSLIGG